MVVSFVGDGCSNADFSANNRKGRRILLTTFGSLGDLYPYLAIAIELKSRGHQVVLATSESHRAAVVAEGIEFYPLMPDGLEQLDQDWLWLKLLNESQRGVEYLVCYLLMPRLRSIFQGLMELVQGADLLVTHPLTLVGSLISELTGIPWISTVLSPSSFLSVYDSVAGAIASPYEQALAAMAKDATLRQLRWHTRFWSAPVRQLRVDLGLPPAADPLYEGQHSPHQVLALFSAIFATPQPDWPMQTCLTGFPFYDGPTSTPHTTSTPVHANCQAQLEEFLATGSAPIVFTLGSSAVKAPGSFYQESLAAIRLLGCRAILLVGKQEHFPTPGGLPKGVMLLDYASHAMLFPHAAAVVQHGGIGTIAQALRAGCPMLVVPHNYEQPDNAERVVQLGVGRQLTKQKATATEIASELQQLLSQPQYRERAQQIRAFVQAENGVTKACEAIEAALD